jgi:LacI family transcriptional regulator
MANIRQSDIAKELNISRVTVSKALRDHPDISPAMKKRVGDVARKKGYVPNLIARQLNARRTFTIGIVVPDLENSFFSYVVDSMIDYATEHGYHAILTVSREKAEMEKKNIDNLIGMRVDGLLICLSQETTDRQVFRKVRKMEIPIVFFDRIFEDTKFSRVVFNDKSGAKNSLSLIIREGYKEIAVFAGYSYTNIGKERTEGYIEALSLNKIQVKKEWILEGGFELKDGYESFMKLYSSGKMPEIIFAVNDRVALGAYKAAREAGLRIPEDIGIMGYGFNEITDFFNPQLTVINQDPRKMGFEAIKLLISEIENKGKCGLSEIWIEEELLWRNSVKRKMKK